MTSADFQPAMGHRAFTPFYDWLHALLDPGQGLRFTVAAHLAVAPGERVLDVACGTGAQAMVLKRLEPTATIEGADIDPEILAIARHKVTRAALAIDFTQASATALPFADGSFDRVTSSLAFHHLSAEDRRRAAAEILRVLRPGGRFLLVDFGGMRWPPLRRLFNRLHGERDDAGPAQVADRLPALLREAGFHEVALRHVTWRAIHFVQGTKPAG